MSYGDDLLIKIAYFYKNDAWHVQWTEAGKTAVLDDIKTSLNKSPGGNVGRERKLLISWMRILKPAWERWLSIFRREEFNIALSWSVCLEMYLQTERIIVTQTLLERDDIYVIPKDCNYFRLYYKSYSLDIMAFHAECLLIADAATNSETSDNFSTWKSSRVPQPIPYFYRVTQRLAQENGLIFDVLAGKLIEGKRNRFPQLRRLYTNPFCPMADRLCRKNGFAIRLTHLERLIWYWSEHLFFVEMFRSTTHALEQTGKAQEISHPTPFELAFVIRDFRCLVFLKKFVLNLRIRNKDYDASAILDQVNNQEPHWEQSHEGEQHTDEKNMYSETRSTEALDSRSISSALDLSELHLIETYFLYRTQSNQTQQLMEQFKAFFGLLLLPIEMVRDFSRVMKLEMDPLPTEARLEWCLCVPQSSSASKLLSLSVAEKKIPSPGQCAFLVDEEQGIIRFIVRLWNAERTENGDLLLEYHFQTQELSMWDENRRSGDSSTPPSTSALLAMMSPDMDETHHLGLLFSKWRQQALSHYPHCIIEHTMKSLLMYSWSELKLLIDEYNSNYAGGTINTNI